MSVPQALRPPPVFISASHAARIVGDRVGWPTGSELNTSARGELTICTPTAARGHQSTKTEKTTRARKGGLNTNARGELITRGPNRHRPPHTCTNQPREGTTREGCFVHSKERGSGEGPDKRGGVLNRLFGSRTRLLGRSQSESQATASRNNRILNVRRLRSMTPTHHFPPPLPHLLRTHFAGSRRQRRWRVEVRDAPHRRREASSGRKRTLHVLPGACIQTTRISRV